MGGTGLSEYAIKLIHERLLVVRNTIMQLEAQGKGQEFKLIRKLEREEKELQQDLLTLGGY